MNRAKRKKNGGDGEPEAAAEPCDGAAEQQAPPAAPELAEDPLEQWKDRALRAQAEMVNMRRRMDHDVEERARMRTEALLHEIILLHDHLDLALAAIPESLSKDSAGAAFLQGLRSIHRHIDGVMRRFGLEIIHPAADHPLDPESHEVVMIEERAGLAAERLDLIRRGYRMGRRILRPAQIKILKPPAADTAEPD